MKVVIANSMLTEVSNLGYGEGRDFFFQLKQISCETAWLWNSTAGRQWEQGSLGEEASGLRLQYYSSSWGNGLCWELKVCYVEGEVKWASTEKSAFPHH